MSTDPAFAAVLPRVAVGALATANTNRDGTGTGPATPIFTAGAGGSKIEEIVVVAKSTTTAGMVRVYLYDGTGTDGHLYDEFPVTALTPGATQAAFRMSRTYPNLVLPTGWSITASTEKAESFDVHVFGADF